MDNNSKLNIKEFLDKDEQKDLLRFLTAGSGVDGKSSLIGRLLDDSKNIDADQLDALERDLSAGGERRACGNKRRMAGKNEFERRHVLGDKALRNVRNALGRRRLDFAVFGREVAENGGKKRRFAAAVRTDEPDALAGRCGEIGALVEQARAAHEREVLQTKHRWRSQSK